jgi:hypothetical protein
LEEPIERTKRTQSANRRSCHGMEVKKEKTSSPLGTGNYGLEHGVQILSEIFCKSL